MSPVTLAVAAGVLLFLAAFIALWARGGRWVLIVPASLALELLVYLFRDGPVGVVRRNGWEDPYDRATREFKEAARHNPYEESCECVACCPREDERPFRAARYCAAWAGVVAAIAGVWWLAGYVRGLL